MAWQPAFAHWPLVGNGAWADTVILTLLPCRA
jgi:hypothetical protein